MTRQHLPTAISLASASDFFFLPCSTASIALTNGGSAGLIYTWLIAWAGFNAVYASMAEMASVAPTTGGQYHWVSEFGPPGYQAFLSYLVGKCTGNDAINTFSYHFNTFFCVSSHISNHHVIAGSLGVLGWPTLVTSIAFQAGTEIQGLLALNYDTYVYERWHGTLLVMAVLLFAWVFNTLLASRLNLVEGAILIVHIFGFFCMLVPLWVLSPRTPSKVVWTTFHDGGWNNVGLSTLIGLITSVLPLLGADGSGKIPVYKPYAHILTDTSTHGRGNSRRGKIGTAEHDVVH